VSSRSPGGADVNILPIEFFIVACTFALFHTFIIVTSYMDISRKMNYNGKNVVVKTFTFAISHLLMSACQIS